MTVLSDLERGGGSNPRAMHYALAVPDRSCRNLPTRGVLSVDVSKFNSVADFRRIDPVVVDQHSDELGWRPIWKPLSNDVVWRDRVQWFFSNADDFNQAEPFNSLALSQAHRLFDTAKHVTGPQEPPTEPSCDILGAVLDLTRCHGKRDVSGQRSGSFLSSCSFNLQVEAVSLRFCRLKRRL